MICVSAQLNCAGSSARNGRRPPPPSQPLCSSGFKLNPLWSKVAGAAAAVASWPTMTTMMSLKLDFCASIFPYQSGCGCGFAFAAAAAADWCPLSFGASSALKRRLLAHATRSCGHAIAAASSLARSQSDWAALVQSSPAQLGWPAAERGARLARRQCNIARSLACFICTPTIGLAR